MKIVITLGGNALLRRGEALSADNQRRNIEVARRRLQDWLQSMTWFSVMAMVLR